MKKIIITLTLGVVLVGVGIAVTVNDVSSWTQANIGELISFAENNLPSIYFNETNIIQSLINTIQNW
jgi:hypothetical protein